MQPVAKNRAGNAGAGDEDVLCFHETKISSVIGDKKAN
jgi:hypothetical protein